MITPSTSTAHTPQASEAGDNRLKVAAQKFEAVFLRQILGAARKARLADEAFGSSATDNFLELADANTADGLAKRGQFGLAAMIERQLTQRGTS